MDFQTKTEAYQLLRIYENAYYHSYSYADVVSYSLDSGMCSACYCYSFISLREYLTSVFSTRYLGFRPYDVRSDIHQVKQCLLTRICYLRHIVGLYPHEKTTRIS